MFELQRTLDDPKMSEMLPAGGGIDDGMLHQHVSALQVGQRGKVLTSGPRVDMQCSIRIADSSRVGAMEAKAARAGNRTSTFGTVGGRMAY